MAIPRFALYAYRTVKSKLQTVWCINFTRSRQIGYYCVQQAKVSRLTTIFDQILLEVNCTLATVGVATISAESLLTWKSQSKLPKAIFPNSSNINYHLCFELFGKLGSKCAAVHYIVVNYSHSIFKPMCRAVHKPSLANDARPRCRIEARARNCSTKIINVHIFVCLSVCHAHICSLQILLTTPLVWGRRFKQSVGVATRTRDRGAIVGGLSLTAHKAEQTAWCIAAQLRSLGIVTLMKWQWICVAYSGQ